MELKKAQIEFIEDDLKQRGIIFDDLREDLVDHICTEVERRMEDGFTFMDAYHKSIKHFKKRGFENLNNETASMLNSFTMLRSYITLTFRNLFKHTAFSAINIIGLSIGMAACFVILQYVNYELSYDTFHKNSSSIYRITQNTIRDGNSFHTATTFIPVATLASEEFAEIEDYNRLYFLDRHAVVVYKDKKFEQPAVLYADANFFEFFSYPLLKGNQKDVLSQMNTVAISESAALRYFNREDPIGKIMRLREEFNDLTLLVTGVFKDPPANSHLKPHMVVSLSSIETLPHMIGNEWNWPFYMNYVRLRKDADVGSLENKFGGFVAKYFPNNDQRSNELYLQPLEDIHLYSHLEYEIEPNGNAELVYLLLGVALLTLIIAYANYINLSTARSLDRAKEVGIRKALGSMKTGLIKQFLTEAMVINLLALSLAAFMVYFFMFLFLDYAGIQIDLQSGMLFWGTLVFLFIIGSFLSSLYPAFVLSSFQPISALRGKIAQRLGRQSLRKALVLVQFVASITLMIAAYAIYNQMQFMKSQPLGMEIENLIVIKGPRIDDTQSAQSDDIFINRLSGNFAIANATLTSSVPGIWTGRVQNVVRYGSEQGKNSFYNVISADDRFIDTYQLQLLAGNNFNKSSKGDSISLLVNETALQQLGFKNPDEAVNAKISVRGRPALISGVIKDYHHYSLKAGIEPLIIFQRAGGSKEYYSVKINKVEDRDALSSVIADIEQQWNMVYPDNPFEFFFLETSFNNQYASDIQFEKVFTSFSLLAIFIACLGLYGLASFVTMKRTKEIGIRKVLGSSVSQIIWLLIIDFSKLIILAGIIAVPISWVSVDKWQSNYAFQTHLSWWVFILPVLLVVIIALITISIQTIKVALINPVKILKYD